MSAEELASDVGIPELDDSAMLKWCVGLTKLHHLVRNVRLASWDMQTTSGMHRSSKKWASLEGDRARKIEAHHRSMSEMRKIYAGLNPTFIKFHNPIVPCAGIKTHWN